MSLAMSAADREKFLADVHVGVLSVAGSDGRGPLTVPVWYSYQPGGTVSVITGYDSRKTLAAQAAGRGSLCAQAESLPYKYVTIEGPAIIENVGYDERLAMACRYLGTEGGAAYMATRAPESGDVVIRISPRHWLSADYTGHL